ncbi:MAG: SPFH domain-containing protein [Candidatus Sericytochromatia bacterium]
MQRTFDKPAIKVNGFGALVLILIVLGLGVGFIMSRAPVLGGILLTLAGVIGFPGLYTVEPNESRVLVFLGSYTGTVKEPGFWWSNPFAIKNKISQRVRNFNSEKIKVNDANGNPIEIAAVVVWTVVSPAAALFDVDSYEDFVRIQSETAIRTLSGHYPYDNGDEPGMSLRGHPEEVSETLLKELDIRLKVAGVKVSEARLTHLAYAPEIAQAMLRRQQAQAVIAARRQIVEGAVGMVQMALHQLSSQNIVDLDDERKAQMVNNLMVALVSEHEAQPIINAGSLY